MDARPEYFENPTDTTTDPAWTYPVPETRPVLPAIRRLPTRHPTKRHLGREVVKSGMAASLAVTVLTGLKILRPMSLHPVAGWIFLGLTVVHTLVYELPKRHPPRV